MSRFTFENLVCISAEDITIRELGITLESGQVNTLLSNSEYEIKAALDGLSGASEALSGTYSIDGAVKRIKGIQRDNRIAFIHKQDHLFQNLTVAENIGFTSIPVHSFSHKINFSKLKEEVEELLQELDFQIDSQEYVANLNNEQKKLVSIARAFYTKPKVIIMSSPVESLSQKNIQIFYDLINQSKKRNVCILYLTNHWEEALRISDRLILLENGGIKRTFLKSDVIRNPQELLDQLGYYNYNRKVDSPTKSKDVLDSVLRAAEFITSEYELKDVLTQLSQQVIKFLNSDGCITYLIDEDTTTVIDLFEVNNLPESKATMNNDVILNLAKDDSPFYLSMHDKNFESIFIKLNQVKTILCVPLIVRSRCIGIMQIFYHQYFVHSDEQISYFQTFAKHAAIAIEDTKLLGRSALLQESHHRIKNNLQAIINLIQIQKNTIENGTNPTFNRSMDEITTRVKSIATVHDLISRDSRGRSVLNIKEIIKNVYSFTIGFSSNVTLIDDLEDILVPYNKATSIALVVSELVSNCIKHAFAPDSDNIIHLSCRKNADDIVLLVENNGISMPQYLDPEKSAGLGISIVTSIIKHELSGSIKWITIEKGTRVEIQFPVRNILVS